MRADSSGAGVGLGIGLGIIAYLLVSFAFVGIFKKANQPVWAAFVPIVNYYFLLKTVGRPGWWLILYFIPCVNIIIGIVVLYDLAQSFGHGIGYTIGLIFLSIIFLYIIGFGSDEYRGPAAAQPAY